MRQFLKFFVALVIAVIIVMAVRLFAFTVYSAPVAIGKELRQGDKVVVNKLSRYHKIQKGDLIVFTDTGEAPCFTIIEPPQSLGMVIAMPGDTILINKQRYRIPYKCCERCQCHDCKLYLIDTGCGERLVHKHQIIGRASRLFH